jgi:hypothetical protein
MEEERREATEGLDEKGVNVRSIIHDAIQEFIKAESSRAEPAYKAELVEERKRREQLERRVNELIEENQRSRTLAQEAERSAAIRAELQRLGVTKVDLGFRAVKDDVTRAEDGRLVARTGQGEVGLREYLAQFVTENPELLPARISGGSGAAATQKDAAPGGGAVDLDKIKPGMSREELDRVRQEIAKIAFQSPRLV